MKTKKEKQRYFNRGHFPRGTRVVIDVGFSSLDQVEKDTAFEAVVEKVEANGPDSWIVQVTGDNIPSSYPTFNIHHVKKILERGTLPDIPLEKPFKFEDFVRAPYWSKRKIKPRSQYQAALNPLINWLVIYSDMLPRKSDHLYDLENIAKEMSKAFPQEEGRLGLYNKKKFKRRLRQIMAHNKVSRSLEQRRMYEFYYDDMEKELDDCIEREYPETDDDCQGYALDA